MAKSTKAAGGDKKKPVKPSKKTPAKSEAVTTGLPLFYNKIEPLVAATHGELKVKQGENPVSFAKDANSLMLTAVEFSQAAHHYPVVFGTKELEAIPFGVMGHTGGKNSFVGEDGKWREGVYIPAYIRRYPFILIENSESKSLALAVDPTSDMLSKTDGKPLFEDGEASEIAKGILNLCVAYHREYLKTKELCKQIDDTGILMDRATDVSLPDGSKARVTGFRVVDEKAFNDLNDKEFLKLRKSGALTLIYCHLWSMRAWKNLLGD